MSGHEHLSEDTLLDAVYGIAGNEADAHLRECADCAQRRKIYERIERPSRKYWLLAPGLAAACALAVGIFIYHPAPHPRPVPRAEISDAQLFGDIYSMEQAVEPAAAAPARALFEER